MSDSSWPSHVLNRPPVLGLVSVIIPTFNRAPLLAEALESISNQTYRPIECVVADDGSTDHTSDVVNSASRRTSYDFKIKLVRQEHKGAAAARNLGFTECNGEYIQTHDSDDLMVPEAIGIKVRQLNNTSAHAAIGPIQFFHADAGQPHTRFTSIMDSREIPEDTDILSAVLRTRQLMITRTLFRRDIILRAGQWDEELVSGQDHDFLVRVAFLNPKYVFAAGALSKNRIHSGFQNARLLTRAVIESRSRILAKIESHLREAGLLEKYKRDLSCTYLTFAVEVKKKVPDAYQRWVAKSRELGPPSRPLMMGLRGRLCWLIGIEPASWLVDLVDLTRDTLRRKLSRTK